MFDLLFPRLYVSTLFDIDQEKLAQQGIRAILMDLDNTIVRKDLVHFSTDTINWLEEIKQRNFKVCIISNNRFQRVHTLALELGLPAICRAAKPRKKPFKRALALLGTKPSETAVIGDQIFTDILGGNRMGLYTILVAPIPGKEFWGTWLISRQLEKVVLWFLRKRKKI